MLKSLSNMSISVKLVTDLWRRCCLFKRYLKELGEDSQTYRMSRRLQDKINLYFRDSFLGKLIEISGEENKMIINGSAVVKYLVNLYSKFKPRIVSYVNASITTSSLSELRNGFYVSPIKDLGVIISVAILLNIFFSRLIKMEIGLWGWMIRGLLLFIGLCGIFSSVSWEELKKTSYFMRGGR